MSLPTDLLARLVGFPSVVGGPNGDIVGFVADYLRGHGIEPALVPGPEGDRWNLFASIGDASRPGYVLSGHLDVVPAGESDWQADPFVLRRDGDRLIGRGACDMKGFVACALAAAPDLAAAPLKRPVHFAFSYDEEVGCQGAPSMIESIAAGHPKPSAVLVGEPTGMKVVTGHKGLYSVRVEITGHEAHSSLVNAGACAVTNAVILMDFLRREGEALRAAAPDDSPFDPPFGTLTIGRMGGGSAMNILAKDAWFEALMRPAPWDDGPGVGRRLRELAAQVEADMRRTAPDASIRITEVSNVPPLRPETNGEAEGIARALTGDNAPRVVSYGTEGGQFQDGGMSAVICGPGHIDQAHQPDEFVEVSQLEACMVFLKKLEQRLSA